MNEIIDRIKLLQKNLPERNIHQPFVSLGEECGELATEILIKTGHKNRPSGSDGVVGESVDALLCLLDIIIIDNPDITMEQLLTIMNKKMDKWEKNYATRKEL